MVSSTNYRLGDFLPTWRKESYRSSMIVGSVFTTPEDWYMKLETFEERVVWARRQHAKITQRELARRMKDEYGVAVGSNYISEIELGKDKRPTFEVVRAMAGAMGVSLDWLARFSEEMILAQGKETDATYFSEEADETAQLIDKMPPEQRGLVVILARSLAETSARQRRLDEALDILDSIERKLGRDARTEVERMMRDRGIAIDGTV